MSGPPCVRPSNVWEPHPRTKRASFATPSCGAWPPRPPPNASRASSSPSEVAEFLKTVRVFGEIEDVDLAELALRLREQHLKKGHVLFREGDIGHEMFVVRRGTMIVSKPVTGKVEQV